MGKLYIEHDLRVMLLVLHRQDETRDTFQPKRRLMVFERVQLHVLFVSS